MKHADASLQTSSISGRILWLAYGVLASGLLTLLTSLWTGNGDLAGKSIPIIASGLVAIVLALAWFQRDLTE